MALKLVLFSSLLVFSSWTFAASNDGEFACNPAGNQQEMNACAIKDFRASDAQLNIQYLQVMDGLSAANRVALRHEQRDWIKLRDPQCKAKAKASEGGSVWPLQFYSCLDAANKKRVLELMRK